MFLLVSVRHVGAHPDGHQHGVSIQISINLGKTFLRISRIRNILLAWILARVFVYLPPFISQIPDLIYWTVLILFWSILNGVTLKTSTFSGKFFEQCDRVNKIKKNLHCLNLALKPLLEFLKQIKCKRNKVAEELRRWRQSLVFVQDLARSFRSFHWPWTKG